MAKEENIQEALANENAQTFSYGQRYREEDEKVSVSKLKMERHQRTKTLISEYLVDHIDATDLSYSESIQPRVNRAELTRAICRQKFNKTLTFWKEEDRLVATTINSFTLSNILNDKNSTSISRQFLMDIATLIDCSWSDLLKYLLFEEVSGKSIKKIGSAIKLLRQVNRNPEAFEYKKNSYLIKTTIEKMSLNELIQVNKDVFSRIDFLLNTGDTDIDKSSEAEIEEIKKKQYYPATKQCA